MDSREFTLLARAAVKALERQADAAEALIVLANEERAQTDAFVTQPGPAFCPHCQMFNPVVAAENLNLGQGKMGDFILAARCQNCKSLFYGIVEGWRIAPTAPEAMSMFEEMKGGEHVST